MDHLNAQLYEVWVRRSGMEEVSDNGHFICEIYVPHLEACVNEIGQVVSSKGSRDLLEGPGCRNTVIDKKSPLAPTNVRLTQNGYDKIKTGLSKEDDARINFSELSDFKVPRRGRTAFPLVNSTDVKMTDLKDDLIAIKFNDTSVETE